MDFESVEQTAKRLQVTKRSVQKWAKDGKIPGVSQVGRTWLIPVEFTGPVKKKAAGGAEEISGVFENPSLFNAVFEPGKCLEYIKNLPEGAQQDVAMAQYHHFRGEMRLAVKMAEPYLDYEDLQVALTASLVYCFANVGLGKLHIYQIGQDYLKKHITLSLRVSEDPQVRSYAIFIATMAHVLFHVPCPPLPPLESVVRYLPSGVRLCAAYLMAHEAYLEKDYARALGMVEMGLAFCDASYVLPQIYLHLMGSVALMNQRKTEEAKNQFGKAWELAQKDGMIEVFGEHIGLLQGLLEVSLKKRCPEEYEKVIRIAAVFGNSWRKLRNTGTNHTMEDQLSAVEMAVAALFQHGWAVKEIAAYMELSPRMVRHYISVVYEKLGITHREELSQHMVW